MSILKNKDMKAVEINMEAAKNVLKQTAISPKEGWDGWVMRIFTLKKDGFTPKHTHDWPHINYIIGGKGPFLSTGKNDLSLPVIPLILKAESCISLKTAGKMIFPLSALCRRKGINKK